MNKIRKGDQVIVIAGRDKGKRGVVSARKDDSHVLVEGVNLVKKHARGDGETPGQIVAREAALRYSSVALADPANGHPVRVTRMFLDDGTKVRVSRGRLASGSVIPMPGEAMGRRTVRATGRGPAPSGSASRSVMSAASAWSGEPRW